MQPKSASFGTLYIIATPIGNLEDFTARAVSTLKTVDRILAENPRHTVPLLQHWGIKKPLIAIHEHNEREQCELILNWLKAGESLALVSDAGTPLISDPGYTLVHEARNNSITVSPIPGPSAVMAALSAAGIPCDTFTFMGFLPAKSAARIQKLQSIQNVPHTLVFFESTHRLIASLDDIEKTLGTHCSLVLAKELTKHFEQFTSGTAQEIKTWLLEIPERCKGEFVIIIPPRHIPQVPAIDPKTLLTLLLASVPLKTAVHIASKITGEKKNTLYTLALTLSPTD